MISDPLDSPDAVREYINTCRPVWSATPPLPLGEPAAYEVLGADATATCLRHRRTVCWMPAPGWWIHADYQSCTGMRNAPAPIVLVPRDPAEEKK